MPLDMFSQNLKLKEGCESEREAMKRIVWAFWVVVVVGFLVWGYLHVQR